MLHLKGAAYPVKVNLVIGDVRSSRVQVDGDLTVRFSQLGIEAPRLWFGLIKTKDEVLVRILLWGDAKQC